jgi:hypothetical protein
MTPSTGAAPAGTCRFCGCTEAKPCKLPDGESCWWLLASRNCCTAPACISAYYAAREGAALQAWRARPRKRTPAQIHALKLEERRAKRRKPPAQGKG